MYFKEFQAVGTILTGKFFSGHLFTGGHEISENIRILPYDLKERGNRAATDYFCFKATK